MKKNILTAILATASVLMAYVHAEESRPNIILIMADDLGYSDLGCYGGEIDTPNLDRLAESGVSYSKFRVTSMCLTSRIAMFSGMSFTEAGRNTFRNSVPLPKVLRESGYRTCMSGKAHGFAPVEGNPETDFGFDRHFGLNSGMASFFLPNKNWVLHGQSFKDYGDDFYATHAITDYAIEFIQESLKEEKPFFAHIAYTAPHSPLQAPAEAVNKYLKRGTYAAGWDALREERFRRQKELGIFPEDLSLSVKGVEIPDWDTLPKRSSNMWELDRDFEEVCMSTYAAMVDLMDQDIGRIIELLDDPDGDGNKSDSVLDNTLILFLSDNGSVYAGPFVPKRYGPGTKHEGYHLNYGWGMLGNTPFKHYKHSSHEGALRSPFIMHWPKGIKQPAGTRLGGNCSVWDIYPTLVELAGADYPGRFATASTAPLAGASLVPSLDPATGVDGGGDRFASSFVRSRTIMEGDWKIVGYWDSPWELYNVANDPTERNNVRAMYPEIFAGLKSQWDEFARAGKITERWGSEESDEPRGWGYDLGITHLGLVSSTPAFMSENVPVDCGLRLEFDAPLDFAGTQGRKIRLLQYGSSKILWEADPDEKHEAQGQNTIVFSDFPKLKPDTHYYITWDKGFLKRAAGSKPGAVAPVDETAVAFRFRTGPRGMAGQ